MTKSKALYIALYSTLLIVNLIQIIPMSVKNISGLFLIIVGCVKLNSKNGFIIAILAVFLGWINYSLGINVDYKQPILSISMGTALYYFTAYYVGKFSDSIKIQNNDLVAEINLRKEVEKNLQEKVTILQSLMDTIPSPVFFTDLDLRYVGCNKACEEFIGIRENEIVGKTVFDVVDEDLARIYDTKDKELLSSSSGVLVYEEKVKIFDGSMRDVIVNKAVYKDDNGNSMGIVGVMTDITYKAERDKLIQAVEEKEILLDKAIEIDKLKTEFFSNVSHELRTPLNVILGANRLMEEYSKENEYNIQDEKVKKNISITKQNCFRLLRLINNLIDITKVDACIFDLTLRNGNIINVIEEITLSIGEYIENKGIKLVFDTEIEELNIAFDEDQVERIMLNLLSNAVKFTPRGEQIIVLVSISNCKVIITVTDTGIGIPKEKQSQIFKRFCQVNNLYSRKHEGSGIGLSLVKSLVEMHEGTISFISKEGEGTTFKIKLPIKTVEEDLRDNKIILEKNYVERVNIEFSDIYFKGA